MFIKKITYTDYNGQEVTDTLHFNFTEAELIEMDHSEAGGLQEKLARIVEEKDDNNIVKYFKEILLAAYGEKSPDGKRFIKNQQTRENFEFSPAYNIMFMELMTEENAAQNFINAIVPKTSQQGLEPILPNENA